MTTSPGHFKLAAKLATPLEQDMTFRIAVVQPIANPIEEAEKNIGDAVDFIARAKAQGADFVCFPETYPGPWRMPST
ncbi:MAG: nitrilase-related carbon-nitrogen hydrolase, partial [Pseudolabrys sp.]